jgi:putative transposase
MPNVRYAFIAENRLIFAVRAMCRMLAVHPSGFYAWLREPLSPRALEDQRQTVLLKQAWDDSGEVYGYRKLHDDLCDLGEDISPNRAWRLARLAGIRAQIGYKKKPGSYGGSPAVVADNTLNRAFDVNAPDQFRGEPLCAIGSRTMASDITYIRTHEGFLYLAVVIDLFSRRVIGWSMQGRTYTDLPLQALLMAVWRRKPKAKVHVHSDQGSQFTSYEWQEFLEQHNLVPSMSRRGNCWDRAIGRHWFKPNGEGRRRELLQPAQTRTHPPQEIQNPRRSPPRRLRLHRDLLQPAAQTREERDAVADRLRTAAETETARRLTN